MKKRLATIESIAKLAFNRINPNPTVQVANPFGEYLARAKVIYAARMENQASEDKVTDGEWEVPSQLLLNGTVKVENNKANISHLKAMRTLRNGVWIQSVGNGCQYTRLSLNDSKTIDAKYLEDSLPYTPLGNELIFWNGTHGDEKELSVVYVSDGTDISGAIELDNRVADFVFTRLLQEYGNPVKEDKTNNNNSGT